MTERNWTEDQIAKMEAFAAARASAARVCLGPEHAFAPRWLSRLAGEFVRASGRPENGYMTRAEAIDGARQFREDVRKTLREAHQ